MDGGETCNVHWDWVKDWEWNLGGDKYWGLDTDFDMDWYQDGK